jgi:hypothetical protein
LAAGQELWVAIQLLGDILPGPPVDLFNVRGPVTEDGGEQRLVPAAAQGSQPGEGDRVDVQGRAHGPYLVPACDLRRK